MKYGLWIDSIMSSVGKMVELETTDGIRRIGRVSGVNTKKFILNSVDVVRPYEIELNGDKNDLVTFDRVEKMTIKGIDDGEA